MKNEALVDPALIKWARIETEVPIEEASQYVGVSVEQINKWEEGDDSPTIRQLRLLAKKYRIPFAAFYLPEPPDIKIPRMRDFRNIGLSITHEDNHIIHFEIRHSLDIRSLLLELSDKKLLHGSFPTLNSLNVDKTLIANAIRNVLNIDFSIQSKWRDPRLAFNYIRDKIENQNILIFQTSELETSVFRALSISFIELPIIIVNRKDSYAGRIFSIFHELIHICMNSNSICDMNPSDSLSHIDREIEVFCNSVASEIYVPNELLFTLQEIESHQITESIIERASILFSCSREVIARKLLDKNYISDEFYNSIHEKVLSDYIESRKLRPKGFIPPSTDVISLLGHKPLSDLFSAMDRGSLTSIDFSEFTNVKLKHLSAIREQL